MTMTSILIQLCLTDLVCNLRVHHYHRSGVSHHGEDVEHGLAPVRIFCGPGEVLAPGTRSSFSLPGLGRWHSNFSDPLPRSTSSARTENLLVLEMNMAFTISPSIFKPAAISFGLRRESLNMVQSFSSVIEPNIQRQRAEFQDQGEADH